THAAVDKMGEIFDPPRRSVLARMTGQKPRRSQLVRIAVLLGLVARQRYQPGFRFRRARRLLARSRSVVEGRQRAIGQRPLDAALDRLMMYAKSLSHGKKRRLLALGDNHLRPLHAAPRRGPRPGKSRQRFTPL